MDLKKIILIAIVAVTFLYLDISLLLGTQLRTLKDMTPRIEKARQDIDSLKRQIAQAKAAPPKQIAKPAKPKKFISEGEITALFEYISTLANKNKVNIAQIKPIKEIKPKDDKLVATGKPVVTSVPPGPESLIISMDAAGGYHNLGAFINDLENSDFFLAVDTLKIAASGTNYFQQKAALSLRTYVKK